MTPLDPAYLGAIASQIATMSSVLGGFAITFFVTLLVFTEAGRAARLAIIASACAAGLFIAAVGASVDVVISTHPGAPDAIHAESLDYSRIVAVLAFSGAIFALAFAIGASGWMRSRVVGLATSLAAGVSLFLFVSTLMVSPAS
ncbi:hypothetical protein [Qipengyuania nanhaisediminis]|uniref:hypothetical protein n=1 Tax=Qipengyuania nanhaisediminis TaxID=604088 RepID=UPI0038B2F2C6